MAFRGAPLAVSRPADASVIDLDAPTSPSKGRGRKASLRGKLADLGAMLRRVDPLVWVLVALVLYMIVFCRLYFFPTKVFFKMNPPEQPIYTVEPGFFPEEQFKGMRERLVNSSLAKVRNALDTANFGHTSGIVLRFNLKGEQRFRSYPKLRDFATFLDAVRVEGANAFVINLLATQPEDPRAKKQRGTAAGEHRDDTLELFEPFWHQTTMLPFQTTVLYLSVPPDMEGGHMVLSYRGFKDWAPAHVRPKENMVLKFRGDAYHHVESYRTDSDVHRCSLVIEQYVLPPELYKKTWTWTASGKVA